MKKTICLILAFACAFLLAACNSVNQPEQPSTEAETTTEQPVQNSFNNYIYNEYTDHVEITEYVGKERSVFLPITINNKPVTSFGTAFKANLTLTSVIIPAGAYYTTIESEAFSECQSLRNVVINKGVEKIEPLAFYGCQELRTITISSSVTEIAQDAFKYCTELVIYGAEGSAAEEFASGFNSIYFRPASGATTAPATEKATSAQVTEESSATETTKQPATEKATTAKKPTTTVPVTAAPTEPVTEETTTRILDIFNLS